MLKKFLSETSANIGIMGAMLIGPMLMAAGVGIDLAERYRATQSYQAAVDAAALAAAKVLSTSAELPAQAAIDAKAYGKAVFDANIENLHSSTGTIVINTGTGDCSGPGIVATAQLRHPMLFDGLHKYFTNQGTPNEMNISVSSTVACGNDTVEVALVLDNSGSMEGNKLSTLKTAAKDLVQVLHNSMTNNPKPNPLKFSLVPFSSMVNVGPNNANANWMDTEGRSSVHHEHLDWASDPQATALGDGRFVDNNNNPLTRFTLYNEMGINWAGCVEARPWPLHTRDDSPDIAIPDTLFVPAFAPDAPDNFSGLKEWLPSGAVLPIHCRRWKSGSNSHFCHKWYDPSYPNSTYTGAAHPDPDIGYANREDTTLYRASDGKYIGPGSAADGTAGADIVEQDYFNDYIQDNRKMPYPKMHRFKENSGSGTDQYSRQAWTWKYFGASPRTDVLNNLIGLPGGPNAWCTSVAINPLTSSKSTINTAIDNMIALGATNVQAGIAWGWRTLSHGEPFSEGRSKQQTDNRKIMIVMTDGNNTYYETDRWDSSVPTHNPAFYSSFAHNGGEYGSARFGDKPRRIFEGYNSIASPADDGATYTLAMNEHQAETCKNAKADGIQIYSIAFQVPEGSSVQGVMQGCASPGADGSPLYYNATDNDKLKKAFESIAIKIRALAVTK